MRRFTKDEIERSWQEEGQGRKESIERGNNCHVVH